MSEIGGKKRELKEFSRKVGLFVGKVVAINPDNEQFKELTGTELEEDSKMTTYLGESREGNTYLRIDFWLDVIGKNGESTGEYMKLNFFLEDKERENKEGTKMQYINTVGATTWADDPNNLPDWFSARQYRVAKTGEEELYDFLRIWLNKLDYRDADTILELEWKKLMKGNVEQLRNQIDGEYESTVGALATVSIKEKDGEVKEYQSVFNRGFFPPTALRHFRLIDYSDKNVLEKLANKKPKDLKPHEKFVVKVTREYGCKDFYILKDIQDYDSSMNIAATDDVISDGGSDY